MIHQIDTLDDSRVDAFRRVGDPAWLRSQELFVAEGRLLVERLVLAGQYEIDSVLLTPPALAALQPLVARLECSVYVAAQGLLNGITGFNFHRGCLALARRPVPHTLPTFFACRRLLGLEGIGNPDNIGGLFRSAAAFGADGVVLDESSADPFYRKALRTSAGAILRVPFSRVAEWPGACAEFQQNGFLAVALVTDPLATRIDAFASNASRHHRVALLVGAEGSGLTSATIEAADVRVTIPMAGGTDSLNVAVAASVAMSWLWKG